MVGYLYHFVSADFYVTFIVATEGTDKHPSVLLHCWLGGRKGIHPVKN